MSDPEPYIQPALKGDHKILYEAQHGICGLCGTSLPTPGDEVDYEYRISIDHVIPRSLGGGDYISNKIVAHQQCNNDKSDCMPNGCQKITLEVVRSQVGTSFFDIPKDDNTNTVMADALMEFFGD